MAFEIREDRQLRCPGEEYFRKTTGMFFYWFFGPFFPFFPEFFIGQLVLRFGVSDLYRTDLLVFHFHAIKIKMKICLRLVRNTYKSLASALVCIISM